MALALNTHQKLLIARVSFAVVKLFRRALGLPMESTFRRGGLKWALNLGEGIDFSIFLLGSFEPDVVRTYRSLLHPGDTVLDLGANIGAHTLPLAKAVSPGGHVYAFEPTAYAFQKLKANLAQNPELAEIVKVHQMAAAADESEALPEAICSGWPLREGEELHPEHGGEAHSTQGAKIATLDSVLKDVKRVAFMKLDVDGHELSVLRGARRILQECRPTILMELCPYVCVEQGHTLDDVLQVLRGANYQFRTLGGKPLPSATAELEKLIPAAGGSINVLAVPVCAPK
jgi:FkbM family methyltransferase